MLCLEALAVGAPAAVAVALGLVLLDIAGPRVSPIAWLLRLIVGPSRELAPIARVRSWRGLAALALAAAVALLHGGAEAAGWVLAGVVAALALLWAVRPRAGRRA